MSTTPQALIAEGYAARRESRPADAKQFFSQAVDVSRQSNDRAMLALALTGVGQIERDQNHTDRARELYEEAVAIYRILDHPRLPHAIRHVGDIVRSQGKMSEAQPYYVEALEIYRRQESVPPLDLANALRGFALLKEKLGEHDAAKALWLEARDLYASVEVQAGVDESESRLFKLNAG